MDSHELQTSYSDRQQREAEVSPGLGATATFAAQVGEARGGDDLVASCGD